ncbi:cytochrome P450-dit2 [Lecanora helva]
MTRDPENVKSVFVEYNHHFGVSANRIGSFWPLLGFGLSSTEGETWSHARSTVRPQFYRDQISRLSFLDDNCRDLTAVLRPGKDGWTAAVDVQPLFLNLTLDAITELVLGQSVDSQRTKAAASSGNETIPSAHWNLFADHFDAAKGWLNTRLVMGNFYWLVVSRKFNFHCRQVHRHLDNFVERRLSRSKPKLRSNSRARFTLLDKLAERSQDPAALRGDLLHIISPGRDTVASLLSWIFYFLARDQEAYAKLRSAILEDFGPDDTKPLDYAKLMACQYLNFVINEVLRLVAIAPIVERICAVDTVLPKGGGPDGTKPIFITKGSSFLISIYAMQRRVDIWGPDAGEFRPERWQGRGFGWEFSPFGGGLRKCIGRTLHSVLYDRIFENANTLLRRALCAD